jgi:hypothetical protein
MLINFSSKESNMNEMNHILENRGMHLFMIKENGFPSDEYINVCVKKVRDFRCASNALHSIRNGADAYDCVKEHFEREVDVEELKVPKVFRESFLNHLFTISPRAPKELIEEWEYRKKHGLSDKERNSFTACDMEDDFYCDFCFTYDPDNLDAFENNDVEEGDDAFGNDENDEMYVCTDFIHGLGPCIAQFSEEEKDLDKIHTLSKINEKPVYKRTSTIYEWITFMQYPCEEESYSLLLNCNEKSKHYGMVFFYGHQEQGKMLCHISEFLKDPFKYFHMK